MSSFISSKELISEPKKLKIIIKPLIETNNSFNLWSDISTPVLSKNYLNSPESINRDPSLSTNLNRSSIERSLLSSSLFEIPLRYWECLIISGLVKELNFSFISSFGLLSAF